MMCEEDTKPQFYKIVHSSFYTTQHLRIPRAFVKYIPKEESGTAVLKGTRGGKWEVKLCKTENGTFLQDGWHNFLRDNSLGDYEVLVFSYDGNLCFDVQIFDKTGCEKQDAFHTTETNQEPATISSGKMRKGRSPRALVRPSSKRRGQKRKGSSPRELVEPSSKQWGQKGKGRSPRALVGPSSIRRQGRPKKKPFSSSGERQGSPPTKCGGKSAHTTDSGTEIVAPDGTKTENAGISICERYPRVRSTSPSRRQPTEEDNAEVLKAAMSFTSSRPHFVRHLNESIVHRSYVVPIPSAFGKVHLPRWKAKVVLEDHRGNTWAVNLIPGKPQYYFCGGWPAFVRDNQLKAGDICIFELIGDLKMHVHIFRICQTR